MPELVDLLKQSMQPKEPSLLDMASALHRSQAEGTSFGKVMDERQSRQSDLAQRGFTNTIALMDQQYKQAKMLAEQGNADAEAVTSAFESVTKDLEPQDAAKVWAYAESLPDDVNRSNAMTVFSRAVRETGVRKPEREPSTAEYERLLPQYEAALAAGNTRRANLLKARLDKLTEKSGPLVQIGASPAGTEAPITPIGANTPPTELGTGMSGRLGGAANWLSDTILGLGQIAPETAEARQALDLVETMTNTVMAANVPGKPSNYVREQFAKIAPRKGMGDKEAKQALERTIQFLDSEAQSMQRMLPTMNTKANVDKVQQAITSFGQLRSMYQSLLDNFDALPSGGNVDVGDVPEGVDAEDWQFMTEEERALWRN